MKFLQTITSISFVIVLCKFKFTYSQLDGYIETSAAYFRERNVRVVTHFSCFTTRDNIKISIAFSKKDLQSRIILKFEKIMRMVDTPKHTIQGFVVDLSCNNTDKLFQHDDHGIIFKDNNFWLFIDNDLNRDTYESRILYEERFKNLNALPISNVFIAKKISLNQWQLFDAYKVHQSLGMEVQENGLITWSERKGNSTWNQTTVIGSNVLAYRRHNLQNISLNCGLVIAYPDKYTSIEDPKTDHIDVFSKAYVNFCAILRENLNMRCNIIQVDSYGWLKNGTFNGAMGLFQQKRIQMGYHGVNMRPERLLETEFAGVFFTPATPIVFRQPPLSAVANIFVLPLSSTVWKCTFGLLMVIFVITVCQFFHPHLRTALSFMDIGTFVMGAFCQQGTYLSQTFSNTSGRAVILVTFLAALALFTSYSASIVALLQSPSAMIKSLEDLIASPLNVYIHEGGYTRFYLLKYNDSVIHNLYESKVQKLGTSAWIYDPFDGIERVRTQLIAFQVDSQSAYKAIAKTYSASEKCSLGEIQMIQLPLSTVPLERNSGYKELVKQRVGWLREIGIIKRDENRWVPKKPKCDGVAEFSSVGFAEIKPAVQILLIGYAIAIAVVVTELFARFLKVRIYLQTDRCCLDQVKRLPEYNNIK